MLYFKYIIISFLAAMKAPMAAIDFAKVQKVQDQPHLALRSAQVLRLRFYPWYRNPWASSTNKSEFIFLFEFCYLGLSYRQHQTYRNTPSVITIIPPPCSSAIFVALTRFFSKLSMSLCLKV